MAKTCCVTFMPWLSLEEPVEIGPIRLLPFGKKYRPSMKHASAEDIEKVLSAYSIRQEKPVSDVVLIEFGEWTSGQDASNYIEELFRVREILAFSSMANRDLFQHGNYWNYDNFTMCIQRYQSGHAGTFSFSSRRRDGQRSYIWGSSHFAFQKPDHVDETKLHIDHSLIQGLLNIFNSEERIWQGINEYNLANTDSASVPAHVELVMMKSAFEWLFEINENFEEFVKSLNSYFPPPPAQMYDEVAYYKEWKSKRKRCLRPLDAWAMEFCDRRGQSAHAGQRKSSRFMWSPEAHMAFASLLFPLALKIALKEKGHYALTEEDEFRIEMIDNSLLSNPMKFNDLENEGMHPWQEMEIKRLHRSLAKVLYAE